MLRQLALSRFIIVAALVFLGSGCASKTVTLKSNPSGANVTITGKNPKTNLTERVRLDDHTTPLTAKLPFNDDQTYTATFEKEQFLPVTETLTREPRDKTVYDVNLTRYIADLMQYPFKPELRDGRWVMSPVPEKTIAYVLSNSETLTPEMPDRQLKRITNNTSPDVDYRNLAASPTADELAYQLVERRALPARSFTVPKKPKMTAAQIARANGVSVEALLEANPRLPRSGNVEPKTTVRIVEHEFDSKVHRHPLDKPAGTRLTADRGNEFTPAYSPDGQFIFYSTDLAGPNPTLWRTRSDGTSAQVTRIVRSDALDYHVSAGKQTLAYASLLPSKTQPSQVEVWMADLDGGNQHRVRPGTSPQFSPDGRQVLFLFPFEATGGAVYDRIWTMNANGSDAGALTANEDCNVIDPQWSPDGKWIVFSANVRQQEKLQNFDLFYMPADGSAPARQLTNNQAYDAAPVFDRTGQHLYFRSNRGGTWNLWRITIADITATAP